MAEHIVSPRTYFRVFVALVGLALLTTGAAFINTGPFAIVIALAIAVTKMMLVILYFMNVRWSSRLTWVFVGAAFAWLIILIVLTVPDYMSRYWLPAPAKAPGMTEGRL